MERLPTARRESLAALGVLALLGCALYGASLGGDFLNWDDPRYVLHNRELQKPLPEALGAIFSTFHFSNYNPLQRASYLLDYKLFGASATAFRATNLALHVLCGWLLFLCLRAWLGRCAPALLAAAVFVAHPANVENAAWISERKSLIAAAFAFGAVLAWLRAGRGWRPGRPLALLLFALGLLGKTSIVVLPGWLLLLDLSERRRPRLGWYAALLVPACVFAAVQVAATGSSGAIRPLHGGGVATHAATAVAAASAHLWSAVQPFGATPRHAFEPVTSAADPRLWAGLSVLALAALGAVRSWRGERRFLVAAGWFALALLPTLLVPIPIVWSERYLYLASPFAIAVAVLAVLRVPARWAVPARAAAAAWAVLLAVWCALYACTWRDSMSLWAHALRQNPSDARAWVSLADARLDRGDVGGAEDAYRTALELDPDDHDARENFAVLCLRRSDLDRAARLLREVLDAAPERGSAWATYGAVLDLQGDEDGASRTFARGLELHPDHVGLLRNAAQFHLSHGRREAAAAVLQRWQRLDPDDPLPRQWGAAPPADR